MKRVGILILNFNSYDETIRYVSNLRSQQDVELSILIVDNCSPNGSYQILLETYASTPDVTVIQSRYNGGYAYGNNFGLDHWANEPLDYILLSNNDIILDDDHLLAILVREHQMLEHPGFIAPRMFVNGREYQKHQAWKLPTILDSYFLSTRITFGIAKWLGWSNSYNFPTEDDTNQPVDCLNGSFFLAEKMLFYELGKLDEHTFLYMEESILGQKIKASPYQNYLIRSIHFHHNLGTTTNQIFSRITLQSYWLQSTLYYHRSYNGLRFWAALPLYLLFLLWIPETWLLTVFKKLLNR